MDDFRLIFVLLGAAVVGAIYLREIVRRRSRDDDDDQLGGSAMHDFDGPRVRRRQGEAPALGELGALEIEPEGAPRERQPAPRPVPAEDPPPAREPEPGARDRPPPSALGAVDVDDIDAIAAAAAAAETRARAQAAREPGASAPPPEQAVAPAVPDAAAARVPVPEEPAPPPATDAASVRPAPAAQPVTDLGEISALADEPEQLDLAGLGVRALDAEPAAAPRGGRPARPPSPPAPGAEPEMVVVLTVMAREGRPFSGPAVRAALEYVGLVHGELQIFHRYALGRPSGAGPVFSVANVRNPGAIDLATLDEMVTPGLAMFMRIPGPTDAGSAFQQMLEAGRRIAGRLEGVLCDETRSTLTKQSVNHIRERIAEHARQTLLSRRS